MPEIDINSIDPRELSDKEFADLLGSVREAGAETQRDGIGAMKPAAFSRLIKRASSAQIGAVLDDPVLRGAVLDQIFTRMADQFRPDKAPRKPSAIHWSITGDGEPDVYETWIADGAVSTNKSPEHEPRVTLAMSGEQFLKLVSGNGSPTMMFMTGKLKLDGDIGFAVNLTNIFDIPKA